VYTSPNTCFPAPTRVLSPNGISIGSAIFGQLTAECRRACPGMTFPLLCLCVRRSGNQSNYTVRGPSRVQIPNAISIGSDVCAQLTVDSVPILYNGSPFPLKIEWAALSPSKLPPFHGDLDQYMILQGSLL